MPLLPLKGKIRSDVGAATLLPSDGPELRPQKGMLLQLDCSEQVTRL